jgi:hypothetical protein
VRCCSIVDVDLGSYRRDGQREQLWLRPAGNGLYELTYIPFCVYGLALLDRVAPTDDGRSVSRVREPSGLRALRILLKESYGDRLATGHDSFEADGVAGGGGDDEAEDDSAPGVGGWQECDGPADSEGAEKCGAPLQVRVNVGGSPTGRTRR